MTHSCYGCANLEHWPGGIWERPDRLSWYECTVHKGYANLLSFPFHNTKCKEWASSLRRPKLTEAMK